MDTRTDFQRLLEDMDRALRRKQQELTELDERLEAARQQLSEKEAKGMLLDSESPPDGATNEAEQLRQQRDFEGLMQEQRTYYERQLANLTEELIELEASNQKLVRVNEKLQFSVDSLKVSNEKLKSRAQTITENLEEVQSANFELNIRLAKAESQSQMQQKLLKKSNEQDQILMNAFNSKLESLKEAIATRDREINRLRLDNQLTLESLGIRVDPSSALFSDDARANVEGDDDELRNSAMESSAGGTGNGGGGAGSMDAKTKTVKRRFITNLIRDKDAQIAQLNEQLMQATRELENNASLIEALTSERTVSSQTDDAQPGESSSKFPPAEMDFESKCRALEVELSEKDKHLHWLDKRNRHFESVLPNKIVDLIEDLCAKCRPIDGGGGGGLDGSHEDATRATGESVKRRQSFLEAVSRLTQGLNELLGELSASQRLMNTVDQLQQVVRARDDKIRRLVRELSEMNARINNDQIDGTDKSVPVPSAADDGAPGSQADRSNSDAVQGVSILTNQELDHDTVTMDEGERSANTNDAGQKVKLANGQQAKPDLESGSAENNAAAVAAETETTPIGTARKGDESNPMTDLVKNQDQILATKSSDYDEAGEERNKRDSIRQPPMSSDCSRSAARPPPTSSAINPDQRRLRTETAAVGHGRENSQLGQVFVDQRARLRQLENENQLLELAMKEILLSIKWSDTRCSTILIDCPSLERLCQLIEARYIANSVVHLRADSSAQPVGEHQDADSRCRYENESSRPDLPHASRVPSGDESDTSCDLFQFVVMKSELDILRGQNEQLRSDLKLQRRDWRLHTAARLTSGDGMQTERGAEPAQGDDASERRIRVVSEKTCEMECQTDSLILIDPEQLRSSQRMLNREVAAGDDDGQDGSAPLKRKERCQNCHRLVRLANHLLDCIVRIESRVNSSDESYISRLLALYQLTQTLSKDLSVKDVAVNHLRRENHLIAQQKVVAEARLRSLEGHLEIHRRMCPLTSYLPTMLKDSNNRQSGSPTSNRTPADICMSKTKTTRSGPSEPVHSLTIRSNLDQVEVPLHDNRIAIALLQSIIGCLQARLDYKDERLRQLEQMLVAS